LQEEVETARNEAKNNNTSETVNFFMDSICMVVFKKLVYKVGHKRLKMIGVMRKY
jgi:hypothetical protein